MTYIIIIRYYNQTLGFYIKGTWTWRVPKEMDKHRAGGQERNLGSWRDKGIIEKQ